MEPGGDLFRCTKSTSLFDKLSIAESKTIRRISKSETGKVLEFPTTDPDTGLKRIRGKMDSDNEVGWITVSGNQGTKFIELS